MISDEYTGEYEGHHAVQRSVREMLMGLGFDLTEENLLRTPERVASAYRDELLVGYQHDPEAILSTCFRSDNQQMVLLKDIEFYSTCSHHLMPFVGVAHVGYIPNGKVVGLSKLARIVECFSRRLQLQERLTDQIVDAIEEHLQPLGVACTMSARHMCMSARGVSKQQSVMVTSAIRGVFESEASTRAEFLALIRP